MNAVRRQYVETGEAGTATEAFARYEFKYLLTAAQREAIETEVAHFMTYDGYVHHELGNAYFVRSLYFEDPVETHYYEKIDGVGHRAKYRLRTYARAPDADAPVYFEKKERHIERTSKHRIAIDRSDPSVFCDPERRFDLATRYPGAALLEGFLFDSIRRSLVPRVLVDYVRRPYVSAYDANFRVTFDSELRAAVADKLFPPDGHWRSAVAGYTILEVKFFRRIPAWFHRILQAHDMRRLSISKFCKGMEVCDLAVDLS